MKNTLRVGESLLAFDRKTDNPYRSTIESAVERSVEKKAPIQFLIFTCSTIRADKMFSDTPWEYVSLDPSGNNLESDLPRLKEVLEAFGEKYRVKISIIVGNTDPYYIYLQQLRAFPEEERPVILKKFVERWASYLDRLTEWVGRNLPTANVEVLSWYELERTMERDWGTSFEKEFSAIYKNIDSYFEESDFEWERRKLSTQFVPGSYFSTLSRPDDALLTDWIRRKFAEYALQGAWLVRRFPNAILIQNEKPSDLRSRMYQPVLREREGRMLPIIYFFGVDNQGYA